MAEPFLCEIRLASFGFAPKGWALCTGQLLPINQNQALFSLLGTTYGGNGQTTFGLPDLRGRVSIHMGQGFTLGQRGGEENHTLATSEMAAHNHMAPAITAAGDTFVPATHVPANAAPDQIYSALGAGSQATAMNPVMVTNAGGSQAHANMMPFSVVNFIIALQGIFPSQN